MKRIVSLIAFPQERFSYSALSGALVIGGSTALDHISLTHGFGRLFLATGQASSEQSKGYDWLQHGHTITQLVIARTRKLAM